MSGLAPRRLYYRVLNFVARLVQGQTMGAPQRRLLLASLAALLLSLAWIAANRLALHTGELPATPAYDRLLFGYFMRLLCGEALLIGGVLLSAFWAQESGRIPRCPTPEESE